MTENIEYILKSGFVSVIRVRNFVTCRVQIEAAHKFNFVRMVFGIFKPENVGVVAPVHRQDIIIRLEILR